MPNEKLLRQIIAAKSQILTIGEHSSFGQTLKKIKNSENIDYLVIGKADSSQMLAALLCRLFAKKFIWIQNFTNPPAPNLLTRLLLSQADYILVQNYYLARKLANWDLDKRKIKIFKA